MASNRKSSPTEQDEPISEVVPVEVVDDVPVVSVEPVTLEEYAKVEKVNKGTIASFKYEARNTPELLSPKSAEDWANIFKEQASKVYE